MSTVPLTTAEDNGRAQARLTAETRAIRMLHAGDEPKQVAQSTGLSIDDVRRLQRDTPGLSRPAPRAVPQPAAQGEPAGACDHVLELPIRVLLTHPANVRSDLGDPTLLDELAQSIRQHGILQPLRVMRLDTEYDGCSSIIVTRADQDDVEWCHASVAGVDYLPAYEDLVRLHEMVFGGGYAYQCFVPSSEHVNIHPFALHLWGRADGGPALPRFGTEGTI